MNFTFLEVCIGIIFIYLLLSLFSTILMEIISTLFRMRADIMKEVIIKMLLRNKDEFNNHYLKIPLVKSLSENKWFWQTAEMKESSLSHLSAENFYVALLSLLQNSYDITTLNKDIEASILLSNEAKQHLKQLLASSNNDLNNFKLAVEKWFTDVMERGNSWYKRRVQYVLLVVGLGIAIAFNADTLRIINTLQNNPKLRAELVQQADAYVQKQQAQTTKKDSSHSNSHSKANITQIDSLASLAIREHQKILNTSGSLLGWETIDSSNVGKTIAKGFLGYILTAFAISLGANFWYDLLKKLIQIRTLGRTKNEDK